MSDIQRIYDYIDNSRKRMIELQRLLCAHPAIAPESGGQGEWEKALALKNYLQQQGFGNIRQIDAPDKRVPQGKRPNLILDFPGPAENGCLWVMTHMDVVPPGEQKRWETDPFTLREKDGKLFARGTEDNQQGLVSSIFALLAVRETGVRP
ncbi:MAG: M20/M25/M40 family metallo-hydrolase, partial [Spirochaetia bacterium]